MRAIYVDKLIPRLLAAKALKRAWPGVVWSPLSPARVAELPEPQLPGPRWVRVRNRMSGICATDLSLLFVQADPSIGPAALPGLSRFYLGHEVVSEVVEVGSGVTRFRPGDRVLMDVPFNLPHCLSQEIQPVCRECERGNLSLCENASAGRGPSGVGGGWSDGYTAHESNLYPCPEDLTDEQASLVEPMSVAMHAVLRRPPAPESHVLVIGAGIIGLLTIQAARAVCPGCRITAMAKYPYQAEMARQCGADDVLSPGEGYAGVARLTGASYYTAPLNKGMLLGGLDLIYDCVGKSSTVEDGLRWSRAGGTVVVIGIQALPMKLDLTPLWYQEVDLVGSVNHGVDAWKGQRRHTYEWVVQLIREGQLVADGLITHRFRLGDYREAVDTATGKSHSSAIKVVFDYPEAAG